MSYGLFFHSFSDDEDEVNSEHAFFTETCNVAIEASKPKKIRNQVERDRYGAHALRPDCSRRIGISALVRCTSVIRQMTYDTVPDALDECLQMGAATACDNLVYFCNAVMELYGREYLRLSTYTDMEKLYAHHE
ncbi:hypothetical protein Tco_0441315 [Tanacetum coccineum]